MKTRIIKTRMWAEDEKFCNLSALGKLGFIYFISNTKVGMTNYYECPDRIVAFEIGINTKQLQTIKTELIENRMVLFYKGWVFIHNLEKHNNYKNGEKNIIAYEREYSSIPREIVSYFDSTMIVPSENPIVPINKKLEIRNNKLELRNTENVEQLKKKFPGVDVEGEIEKMMDWLASSGKQKKDYIAFARNWLRRAQSDVKKVKSNDRSNL